MHKLLSFISKVRTIKLHLFYKTNDHDHSSFKYLCLYRNTLTFTFVIFLIAKMNYFLKYYYNREKFILETGSANKQILLVC